ncbi:MAG TPA: DUF3857 domain-containing protein [Flavobacterium sp.]|uniref:DUF3857 domain-containing protein n=1 Tax=Flavobacterium sp. TaxID=239 RepID=UPI002B4AEC15|nr:DUF3857 domain-containing protein [Flavobacterium sp.]HLO72877.1 DUF3857 domain-containing protein [Flavobacterium sp.]
MKQFSLTFLLLNSILIFSQEIKYSSLLIPKDLAENANSIIRNQEILISVNSQNSLTIKKRKVVTVLNSLGLNNVDAKEYYSKSEKIKNIEAIIYNDFGSEIKKIKKKDFRDQSVADGFSVLTDGRMLYLDYTPTSYPFTIAFESEVETINTAFIPTWYPIDDYFESVEKSSITVNFINSLGFKYKEKNFENRLIKKSESSNTIMFSAENILAEKPEDYAPSADKILPNVVFGLDKFNLEGFEGSAKSWQEFGILWYKNLVSESEEISEETKNKLKALVANETDDLKKAQIVYEFMQNRTRYVSIQLGIGGWKPMLPLDVDKLGYGDCKALSNYTRVLLKNVGVNSYYTVIYGDSRKKDFEKDFVSKQGNHVILTIPNGDKNIFLECTNQKIPFGFGGDFTDDRHALLIKPDGGEIIKTTIYTESDNIQLTEGSVKLNSNGAISGVVKIVSKGIQYDDIYGIEDEAKEDVEKHYKSSRFHWLNNLKINAYSFKNDKKLIEFTENLTINAENYVSIVGNSFMLPVNIFNRKTNVPQRYRIRKQPFEIQRGYTDIDIIQISIPEDYKIEALPDNITIENKFGTYKFEILTNNNLINYKRTLIIKQGFYDKSEYENYRQFIEQIVKHDNSKILFNKL